ncbi:MAG: DUF2304 domain-containing protein [Nitriliruptorales bacterium]
MTGIQAIVLVTALGVLLFILELVRRRELREKYAVLWVVLGAATTVLAVYPRLLERAAAALGVAEATNLLFFVALIVLLLVVVHLSWEISRLERETRTLAEELALQKLDRQLEEEDS